MFLPAAKSLIPTAKSFVSEVFPSLFSNAPSGARQSKPPVVEKSNPPAAGESVVIPDGDPTDISFMEGCWRSDSKLVLTTTGQPLFHMYCFDKTGTGTLVTELKDASGKLLAIYDGTAAVTRDGPKLTILDSGTTARNSKDTINPKRLTCEKTSSGRTTCSGVPLDPKTGEPHKPFNVDLIYHGATYTSQAE
jgi:hypothetical protein